MDFAMPVLAGGWVQLEPMAAPHRDGLRRAADDERHLAIHAYRGEGAGFRYVVRRGVGPAGRRATCALRRPSARGRTAGRKYELPRTQPAPQADRDRVHLAQPQSMGHPGQCGEQAAVADARLRVARHESCVVRHRCPQRAVAGGDNETRRGPGGRVPLSHDYARTPRSGRRSLSIVAAEWPRVKQQLAARLADK